MIKAPASASITSKGYSVLKAELTNEQKQAIEKELNVRPFVRKTFGALPASFKIFGESALRYYLPRQWAINKFGLPEEDITSEGGALPMRISFKGTPYPYQQVIIDKFMEEGGNGLICVPCGRGKTFMALSIACLLGKRFMIVVDKEFLMNQWKGEIERYIEGARVGILQSNKQQVDPVAYDITICMIQTICTREFPADLFSTYGFTIFDECHHLGAQHFSNTLKKIQTKYMLGLSATPTRDDGLTRVFEYFIGKPVYEEKEREPDPTVEVHSFRYKSDDASYADIPVNWKGEVITARLLNQVAECSERTSAIIDVLITLFTANNNRKILVLSDRKAHLEAMNNELMKKLPVINRDGHSPPYLPARNGQQNINHPLLQEGDLIPLFNCPSLVIKTGYYIGGMKQAILDKNAEECDVLFATYAMSSEAMNIKALNTLIMASPRKKVEQSTGRILRVSVDKRTVNPVIIDVVDQHGIYQNQWYARRKYYLKCNYTIKHFDKSQVHTFLTGRGGRGDRGDKKEFARAGAGAGAGAPTKEAEEETEETGETEGDAEETEETEETGETEEEGEEAQASPPITSLTFTYLNTLHNKSA